MGQLFGFSGRAGRLIYWAISLICALVVFGIELALPEAKIESGDISMVSLFFAIFTLFLVVWIAIAVTVRRFHDRGKSGWWALALLIPLVGLWFSIELAFFGGIDQGNPYA